MNFRTVSRIQWHGRIFRCARVPDPRGAGDFSAARHGLPRTVGLFLFGAFAWRSGVLRRASANRRLLFGVATLGILLGGGLSLAAAGQELFDWPSLGRARFPVERLGAVVLALGYVAAVIAAVNLSGGRRILGWAAPLGRMAFTNYLAQSVICGWIFYGYGLSQFGRLGVAADTGDRHFRVCRAGGVQRVVAAPLSVRSCRVALALVHVWGTAADAGNGQFSDHARDHGRLMRPPNTQAAFYFKRKPLK